MIEDKKADMMLKIFIKVSIWVKLFKKTFEIFLHLNLKVLLILSVIKSESILCLIFLLHFLNDKKVYLIQIIIYDKYYKSEVKW